MISMKSGVGTRSDFAGHHRDGVQGIPIQTEGQIDADHAFVADGHGLDAAALIAGDDVTAAAAQSGSRPPRSAQSWR